MQNRDHLPWDGAKSLEDISGISWGDIGNGDNGMVSRRKRIRKTPIRDLTPDDLNVILGIGQDDGFAIRHALQWYRKSPVPMSLLIRMMRLTDVDWHREGELLAALRCSIDEWRSDYLENQEDEDCARQCGQLFFEYAYFERRLNRVERSS